MSAGNTRPPPPCHQAIGSFLAGRDWPACDGRLDKGPAHLATVSLSDRTASPRAWRTWRPHSRLKAEDSAGDLQRTPPRHPSFSLVCVRPCALTPLGHLRYRPEPDQHLPASHADVVIRRRPDPYVAVCRDVPSPLRSILFCR